MDHTMNTQNGYQGRLPAMAPLANPYVPFQLEGAPKYEARKAIIRGTLYPGLDLPFMGMVNDKELPKNAKTELQTLAFAIQELVLYLDTHSDDREALALYRQYQDLYHRGMTEYTKKYGPLNHTVPGDGESYNWLDDPWPWEYAGNKED